MNTPLLRLLSRAVLLTMLAGTAVAATRQRPNVLFIAIDDLRDWVGYIDRTHQAKTPNGPAHTIGATGRGTVSARKSDVLPAYAKSRDYLQAGGSATNIGISGSF